MPTFTDYETVITASWLNGIDTTVNDVLASAVTAEEARAALGVVEEAPNDGTIYARQSLTWVEAPGSTAPTIAHPDVTERDSPGAHPISAITDLATTLSALDGRITALEGA